MDAHSGGTGRSAHAGPSAAERTPETDAALWTYDTLCRDLGIAVAQDQRLRDARFLSVSTVPQLSGRGSLYIDLPSGSDRADSVMTALARGAAAVLSKGDLSTLPPDAPIIEVPNPRNALKTLAMRGRQRFRGDLVAVTGSVGKTTIKDMTRHILSGGGGTYGVAGNRNGTVGISAALASIPQGTRFVVLEVSATGPRTLSPRIALAAPTIGVLSNAEYSHGGNYEKPADIVAEKLSLFDHLTGDRIAIVGRSVVEKDRNQANLLSGKRIGRLLTVGTTSGDAIRLREVHPAAASVTCFLEIDGRPCSVAIPAAGAHFAENAMFAMAVAYACGLDLDAAARSFESFVPPARRTERLRVDIMGQGTIIELIDDAANSSPTSVCALLGLLRARTRVRRKILVFGDMLELGPGDIELHEALADDVLDSGIDLVLTIGPRSRALAARLEGQVGVRSFADSEEAAAAVPALLQAGDLVALKASLGTNLRLIRSTLAPHPTHCRRAGSWAIEEEVPSSAAAVL